MWQWWLFSGAFAIATWAVITSKDARDLGIPQGKAAGLVVVRLLVSLLILGAGFIIEPLLAASMGHEAPEGTNIWVNALFSALVPACLVTYAAGEGRSRWRRVRNASEAAVISLMLLDNFWNILAPRPLEAFLFSMGADLVGGIVAGVLIGLITERIKPRAPAAAAEEPPRPSRTRP
jgi:hypothetical protein